MRKVPKVQGIKRLKAMSNVGEVTVLVRMLKRFSARITRMSTVRLFLMFIYAPITLVTAVGYASVAPRVPLLLFVLAMIFWTFGFLLLLALAWVLANIGKRS